MRNYRPHLFVLCFLAVATLTGMHQALRTAITDLRFGLFPRAASGEIVLVAIDATSINEIGVWPWPRRLHADLVDRLTEAGAADIVFDVDFSSASTPEMDAAFAAALERAGGSVILPSFKQVVRGRDGETKVQVNRPMPEFLAHSWSGTVNVTPDADGRVRHYAFGELLDGEFFPSIGALLAGKYETGKERFRLDFSIQADSVPHVPFIDVLAGTAKSRLAGKKVVVGGTAVELGDRINVPAQALITGPTLQVLAAESILQGRMMTSSSDIVALVGLLAVMLLMMVLWSRLTAPYLAAVALGMAGSAEAAAIGVQASWPVVVDTAYWHLAALAYLVTIGVTEINVRGLIAKISERRFSNIAMSLGDGLVCADHEGRITLWNPGATAIFGYEQADIVGQQIVTLWRNENGGQAFDPRAFSLDELQREHGTVRELTGVRKDGTEFSLEASFSAWPGADGINYGAVLRDISVRKREEQRIRYLAEHDTLTGLLNRNMLRQSLIERMAEPASDRFEFAVLLLGVDHLKEINDRFGHERGDDILRCVARSLDAVTGEDDLAARLGGDEFAIVLSGPKVAEKAEDVARSVTEALGRISFSAGGGGRHLTASIGLVIHPNDSASVDGLLANADLAMYRAKEGGRNRHVFFHAELRDEIEARRILKTDLARAMRDGEFELFYQPQIRLADGMLVGVEALARWRHPERGLVPPDSFIPAIDEMPIAGAFAHWVMETACRQGRVWQDRGFDVRMGVNLSPCQFKESDLVEEVREVLATTGLSPELLELEVTENILIEDDAIADRTFGQIQQMGVNIAFDDFGTGYASLSYLRRFKLDTLKIDKSFIQELMSNSGDEAIVRSTIALSDNLGLSVICEGIEDQATADLLLGMGCAEGQGYHYSRPVPAAEFEEKFLVADSRTKGVFNAA